MESATEPRGLPAVHRPVRDLDRREREILAFEGQWWKYAGAKEQAVRELFDMSPTRYYQVLNALIDKPEALAAEPLLIKRLRRLRASRQRTRRPVASASSRGDHPAAVAGTRRSLTGPLPASGGRRDRIPPARFPLAPARRAVSRCSVSA